MVDLVTLQTISYIAGSLGVVLGVVYYAINLKEQRKNSRITMANSLTQRIEVLDFHRNVLEIMSYEWKDFDDYQKKYGTDVNPDAGAKRLFVWRIYNALGSMLLRNMIDVEVLYDHGGDGAIWMWAKYEPIIRESRRYFLVGNSWMKGFEYLADEMMKVARGREPTYRMKDTFYKYVPENHSPQ